MSVDHYSVTVAKDLQDLIPVFMSNRHQELDALDSVDRHHPTGEPGDPGRGLTAAERTLGEPSELRGIERRLLGQAGAVLRQRRLGAEQEHQDRRDDMPSSVHRPPPCSRGIASARLYARRHPWCGRSSDRGSVTSSITLFE